MQNEHYGQLFDYANPANRGVTRNCVAFTVLIPLFAAVFVLFYHILRLCAVGDWVVRNVAIHPSLLLRDVFRGVQCGTL